MESSAGASSSRRASRSFEIAVFHRAGARPPSSSVRPGIAGSLFWGSRSYNFHANYVLAAGLLVGYRHSFGESKESALLVAAQLDLALLALPVILLVDMARGPSEEAAPLE